VRLFTVPLGTFLRSNLMMSFCFRGRVVTPGVSNPHDYVDHVFKRPKSCLEFKIKFQSADR
jgi:hypothetical protein